MYVWQRIIGIWFLYEVWRREDGGINWCTKARFVFQTQKYINVGQLCPSFLQFQIFEWIFWPTSTPLKVVIWNTFLYIVQLLTKSDYFWAVVFVSCLFMIIPVQRQRGTSAGVYWCSLVPCSPLSMVAGSFDKYIPTRPPIIHKHFRPNLDRKVNKKGRKI